MILIFNKFSLQKSILGCILDEGDRVELLVCFLPDSLLANIVPLYLSETLTLNKFQPDSLTVLEEQICKQTVDHRIQSSFLDFLFILLLDNFSQLTLFFLIRSHNLHRMEHPT
jgi:hypothetical protein